MCEDGAVKDAVPSPEAYRICPSTDLANSSDHPDRFRFRRMEISGRALRNTFNASFLSAARFSGP